MSKQPKESTKLLAVEGVVSNQMLKTMFPNLNILATIILSLPIATSM